MTWRYQAVYIENHNGNKEYSICEVYLDDDGKLDSWTESHRIHPFGSETLNELINDLQRMMDDANRWKPVPTNKLQVGMTFEQSEKKYSNHNR